MLPEISAAVDILNKHANKLSDEITKCDSSNCDYCMKKFYAMRSLQNAIIYLARPEKLYYSKGRKYTTR